MANCCISGCVLASLWHHIQVSPGDTEGLLFGSLTETIKTSLKDLGEVSEYSTEYKKGILKREIIEPYLNDNIHSKGYKLLGFFKARRNSPLQISLREKSVLKNFSRLFKSPPIFLLLSQSNNNNQSVYSFDYRVYCNFENKFYSLPILIPNLLESSREEYNVFSTRSSVAIENTTFADIFNTGIQDKESILECNYRKSMECSKDLSEDIFSVVKEIREIEKEIKSVKEQIKVLK